MPSIHIPLHFPNKNYQVSDEKIFRTNRVVRLASVAYLAIMAWNAEWILTSLNLSSLAYMALAALFTVATLSVFIYAVVHVINNWFFKVARPTLYTGEYKPHVAVIIPTYNESELIVSNTIKSVILQEWPAAKMVLIVSDDGRRESIRTLVETLNRNSKSSIVYINPPLKSSPLRNGEAKAGNLNAALAYIKERYPYIEYIETRDADDLVANKHFISHCVAYLEDHPGTSFVQTIKQCRVSQGDPFSNQESLFYQRAMPAKFAANAVFPCGSGLVWRHSELDRINGFPGWNLVEDLQSGYEILRRGGRGAFLNIIGAMGQIAPEDIPNFYKQRGTWALDTLRLFYYKNPFFTKGLTIWQKFHFFELQFSYVISFMMAIFIIIIALGLNFNISPVVSNGPSYSIHLFMLAIVLETYSVARARGISYQEQWRARQIWLGLMPVFISSAVRALVYGRNKKPAYKVTRKFHKVGLYLRETSVQIATILLLSISLLHNVLFSQESYFNDAGLQLWALFFIYGLSRVVQNSWHNYTLPVENFSIRKLLPI